MPLCICTRVTIIKLMVETVEAEKGIDGQDEGEPNNTSRYFNNFLLLARWQPPKAKDQSYDRPHSGRPSNLDFGK